MKRVALSIVMVVCCMSETRAQDKAARFILDFRPGSFLLSSDMDGFVVSRTSGSVTQTETIEGYGSWTPSVNAGAGINLGILDLNITGGPGYLWNMAFHGPFWQADIGAMFKLANGHFRIGPHLGILGLGDATWDSIDTTGVGGSDPQVDFTGNTGLKGGLSLRTGGDRVAFLANFDFVDVAYDVTTRDGWVARDDQGKIATELDMSGVMIDLGLMVRF